MHGAHIGDAVQLAFDLLDARLDLAAIRFDLRFARPAEESEAAPLALKMRP
jgi:hypothetical protein